MTHDYAMGPLGPGDQLNGDAVNGRKVRIVHPYLLHDNFVNRHAQTEGLTNWWENSSKPIYIMEALGGAGKSALTWVWLQTCVLGKDVGASRSEPHLSITREPASVFWWSFYEVNSRFRDFLSALDAHLLPAAVSEVSPTEKMFRVVAELAVAPHLVVLDGLERILRFFDHPEASIRGTEIEELILPCSETGELEGQGFSESLATQLFLQLLASPMESRLLCSTRMIPDVLLDPNKPKVPVAGVEVHSLEGLGLDAAMEFFEREGVRASRDDVAAIGGPVRYHPLFLRLISGYLASLEPASRGDLRKAFNYQPFSGLKAKRQHVLSVTFDALPRLARQLLSRLAACRMALQFEIVEALSPVDGRDSLLLHLSLLERRGLILADNESGRYDLHPIVREYAYSRLPEAERHSTHEKIFESMRLAAGLPTADTSPSDGAEPNPDHFTGAVASYVARPIDGDLPQLIEIFRQLASAGQSKGALHLYQTRLSDRLFFRFGSYNDIVDLLSSAFDGPQFAELSPEQRVWVHNHIGICHSRLGNLEVAANRYREALLVDGSSHSSLRAIVLQNQSEDLRVQGRLRQAADVINESQRLAEAAEDEVVRALALRLGGYIKNMTRRPGGYEDLDAALEVFRRRNLLHPQLYVHTNRAWGNLLEQKPSEAIAALDSAAAVGGTLKYQRDTVRILFLRGAAHRQLGDLVRAEELLRESLAMCARIGLGEVEADVATELARTLLLTEEFRRHRSEIRNLLRDALRRVRQTNLKLQEADVHLALGYFAQKAGSSSDSAIGQQQEEESDASAWRSFNAAQLLAECEGAGYRYERTYREAKAAADALR